MKIGIFGGTFNPVHRGHITIANNFRDKYHLDKLVFIPNNVSPFKTDFIDIAPAEHRLKMLELAIADEADFSIDDFEIMRDEVSYTIDTVNYMKEKYPNAQLLLLIGTDQAINFHKWKDYNTILQKAIVVIARRRSADIEKQEQISPALKNSAFLDNDYIDISSSEIRRLNSKGEPIYKLVPFAVAEYIINNILYL